MIEKETRERAARPRPKKSRRKARRTRRPEREAVTIEKEAGERSIYLLLKKSRRKAGHRTVKYHLPSAPSTIHSTKHFLMMRAKKKVGIPENVKKLTASVDGSSLPLKDVPKVTSVKARKKVESIVLRATHPALEEGESLFRGWYHGTHSPSPKERVQRWLEREKRLGKEHYRRVLNLGDQRGSKTLGELIASGQWDEALAIIQRVDHG